MSFNHQEIKQISHVYKISVRKHLNGNSVEAVGLENTINTEGSRFKRVIPLMTAGGRDLYFFINLMGFRKFCCAGSLILHKTNCYHNKYCHKLDDFVAEEWRLRYGFQRSPCRQAHSAKLALCRRASGSRQLAIEAIKDRPVTIKKPEPRICHVCHCERR